MLLEKSYKAQRDYPQNSISSQVLWFINPITGINTQRDQPNAALQPNITFTQLITQMWNTSTVKLKGRVN